MTEPNILLARIDNRLVHGQVGMTWVNTIGANLVIVANDDASVDEVQKNLMEMVIPETVGIRFFTLARTIEIISKASPKQKILLVVKTPEDALVLNEGGVPVKTWNIGNLHFAEGKTQLSDTVSVSPADVAAFEQLHQQGIALSMQAVPSEHETDLMTLLK